MIRQKPSDEEKLKFVKKRFEDRPIEESSKKRSNDRQLNTILNQNTNSLSNLPVKYKETNLTMPTSSQLNINNDQENIENQKNK